MVLTRDLIRGRNVRDVFSHYSGKSAAKTYCELVLKIARQGLTLADASRCGYIQCGNKGEMNDQFT